MERDLKRRFAVWTDAMESIILILRQVVSTDLGPRTEQAQYKALGFCMKTGQIAIATELTLLTHHHHLLP